MNLQEVSKEDLIKALRKIKGVICYIIEDKYIIEIEKENKNGTKIN